MICRVQQRDVKNICNILRRPVLTEHYIASVVIPANDVITFSHATAHVGGGVPDNLRAGVSLFWVYS